MQTNNSAIDFEQKRQQLLEMRKRILPGLSVKLNVGLAVEQHLLSTLCDSIDISQPIVVSSHRKKIGWVIVLSKRIAMKIARPAIKILLKRQILLNEQTLNLAVYVLELKKRVHKLEQKLNELGKG